MESWESSDNEEESERSHKLHTWPEVPDSWKLSCHFPSNTVLNPF